MAKSDKKATANSAEDALNAAQGMFSANPVFQPPAMHFLMAQGPIQDGMREEAEKFSAAWFKRREDASRALMDAAVKMSTDGLKNPVTAMKIFTDWQAGAMERIAEDAKDCTQMVTRCAENLVKQEIDAVDEVSKSTHVFEKSRHATPV